VTLFGMFGRVPKNHHPGRLLPISFSPLADVVFYAKFLALLRHRPLDSNAFAQGELPGYIDDGLVDTTVADFLVEHPAWKTTIIEPHKQLLSGVMRHWVGRSLRLSGPGLILACLGPGLTSGVRRTH
jgi:hypothetical protein